MHHTRIFSAIQSDLWAIQSSSLAQIISIAENPNHDLVALETQLGKPLNNSQAVTTRGAVAIVPVTGPIFRYANLFTAISGATSIDVLALDLQAAVDNPAIKAIILTIDSPGGQAAGIAEMAQQIRTANATKPVWAYVGDKAASAGYWLAASCARIVGAKTSEFGCLGAMFEVLPPESNGKMRFISADTPHKNAEPGTEAGNSNFQYRVDRLGELFLQDVADYRGKTYQEVKSNFGMGNMLIAADAFKVGMIDEISTFEKTLANLQAQVSVTSTKAASSRGAVKMDKATLKAQHPETYAEIYDEGKQAGAAAAHDEAFAAGAKAELTRIQEIEALAMPGNESLIASFKADQTKTAAQAAVAIVQAQKEQQEKALANLQANAAKPVDLPASTNAATSAAAGSDDAYLAEWQASAALQAEFPESALYVSFKQAEAAGRL